MEQKTEWDTFLRRERDEKRHEGVQNNMKGRGRNQSKPNYNGNALNWVGEKKERKKEREIGEKLLETIENMFDLKVMKNGKNKMKKIEIEKETAKVWPKLHSLSSYSEY